jgi:hypothetical protein
VIGDNDALLAPSVDRHATTSPSGAMSRNRRSQRDWRPICCASFPQRRDQLLRDGLGLASYGTFSLH